MKASNLLFQVWVRQLRMEKERAFKDRKRISTGSERIAAIFSLQILLYVILLEVLFNEDDLPRVLLAQSWAVRISSASVSLQTLSSELARSQVKFVRIHESTLPKVSASAWALPSGALGMSSVQRYLRRSRLG
jgi:hypothetical protein